VVAHGLSLHDENSYYVIHRFDNLAQREQMEESYYTTTGGKVRVRRCWP
jgi:hypothetical protein